MFNFSFVNLLMKTENLFLDVKYIQCLNFLRVIIKYKMQKFISSYTN